jgi:hypothetical protein
MIRNRAIKPLQNEKAFEVVLKAAKPGSPEGRKIIEFVEQRLHECISDFAGRLTGPMECIFYVVGDEANLSEAVAEIAKDAGLRRQHLQVRRAAKTEELGRRKSRNFEIFSVPLPNGLYGYVQKLDHDAEIAADLVRVYAHTSERVSEIVEIVRSREMFPPVFTLVSVGVCTNGWKRIGRFPVRFEWPIFRDSASSFLNPGEYSDWYLWSQPHGRKFAGKLNEAQRELEFLCTWAPFAVVKRMVTGINPASEVR